MKSSETATFTAQQLADWKVYEKFRQSGRWSICDLRARKESGLDNERYEFMIQNYSELQAAAQGQEGEE